MPARLFLIAALLSSSACSSSEEMEREMGLDADTTQIASTSTPRSGEAVTISEETDQYMFEYAWPGEASAIPALADELRRRADRSLVGLKDEAAQDFAAAQNEDWTARPHSVDIEWKLVADLPGWLSLSGDLATYSGGAHGNYGVMSLVWDKRRGRAMEGAALFNSPQELGRALGQRLCDALNAERAKRRGQPVAPDSDEMFDQCPGIDEASVLVGSANGQTFDRLTIYFGPYVAGPYAEGDFELDFPVTASVIDAVKPEYADAFSLGARNSAR